MKLLRNLLDSVKPNFEEGGKLEKMFPAFDAFETFLFVPGHETKTGAHIRDGIDLKRTMITVVIAMIPCLLFGAWNVGRQYFAATGQEAEMMDMFIHGMICILPIVAVSYIAGLTVEFIFAIKNGHSVNEGFLVSGMLIPLVMPVDVPLWMVAIATIFAVVIGKEVFGGTGMNVLNPALTARAFLFFAYPTKMSGVGVWINTMGEKTVDGFTGATPLADAYNGLMTKVPAISDAFFGGIAGSVGETSALACLIGAAILLYTGIASWRVMLSMFIGGFVMATIFSQFAEVEGVNGLFKLAPMHQLMLGGFMFGLVFMATDPVSAAQTNTGKYIYGFFCGFLAIMIRVVNPAYPEGVMMAILFMNVMAPMIDHYVIQANIGRRLKRVKAA